MPYTMPKWQPLYMPKLWQPLYMPINGNSCTWLNGNPVHALHHAEMATLVHA